MNSTSVTGKTPSVEAVSLAQSSPAGPESREISQVPEMSTLTLVLAAGALWLLRFLRRNTLRSRRH